MTNQSYLNGTQNHILYTQCRFCMPYLHDLQSYKKLLIILIFYCMSKFGKEVHWDRLEILLKLIQLIYNTSLLKFIKLSLCMS